VVVIFKAMGVQCEQEILQMIGGEEMIATAMIPCFEECHQLQIFTKDQVSHGCTFHLVTWDSARQCMCSY